MASISRSSSLTPCRSPSPSSAIPVQPDHFYDSDGVQIPPSPNSIGKTWLDPADDPLAARGIPVFKPTMAEFRDFENYMKKIECWGQRSGIVKVIPPKEWSESLPDIKPQMVDLKIHSPIEQNMFGSGGLFRQENIEKRKNMSIREWAELCSKEDFRAPGVQEVGLTARSANTTVRQKVQKKGKGKASQKADGNAEAGPSKVMVKEEPMEDNSPLSDRSTVVTPPSTELTPPPAKAVSSKKKGKAAKRVKEETPKVKTKRATVTRAVRTAREAEKSALDQQFLETFDPREDWLPPNTKPEDYNAEFCQVLERRYWRNCGLGKPAWYGADTQGSLFTDETTSWNVAHLPSTLSRLLPSSEKGLPGVNTPYLYFGMWRATFAWHVEDMDLFSINYIHFGAPKFWYAIPQGKATSLERAMRGYFPKDTSKCPQFLRHKSFLASPTLLANSSCRPNRLVQKSGEFVITYPRGYHAGFNLGLNCAESVNFALDSWIELGRNAKACECIGDSVRIDVDQLLRDRAEEEEGMPYEEPLPPPTDISPKSYKKKDNVKQEIIDDDAVVPKPPSRKRKSEPSGDAPKPKKVKTKSKPAPVSPTITISPTRPKLSITLKLPPKPAEPEPFPCCLCVSMNKEGLLRVADPPIKRKDAVEASGNPRIWMAHEFCANVVPETWVDELELPNSAKERVVLGVDGIVKDRWNLKCSACTKSKPKAHGAPVQCTKGKCPKAFHVNCARDGQQNQIVFSFTEVEKEVVLVDSNPARDQAPTHSHQHVESNGGLQPAEDRMAVDPQPSNNTSNILKTIKKYEVEILCTQHNPVGAVAARKKASKQDKIRNDLLALPSMSRIKIRVSSGVFEVSLLRVIEETGSVEVIWDQGMSKEFKWGSVVFGSTDGPVQQKPAERAPERPSSSLSHPVNTYASITAATGHTSYVLPYAGTAVNASSSVPCQQDAPKDPTTTNTPASSTSTKYAYPNRSGAYDYWNYASQYAAASAYPYAYGGYYTNPIPGGTQAYVHPYAQSYPQTNYRQGQLQWQQPYQGPSQHPQNSTAATENPPTSTQNTNKSYYRDRPTIIVPPMVKPTNTTVNSTSSSQTNTPSSQTPVPLQTQPRQTTSSDDTPAITATISNPGQQSSESSAPSTTASLQQINALASMQPSEIVSMLSNDPQLMAAVMAAINQNQEKDSSATA
ncbi:hypothetical protein CVT24_001851 [Panaeolus cyanescens]|uniref:[histone H3]-trimethyl-L-lysine(9) demethylase n=1 Tax=Panaeolus cyanescens TaxID=181874 RepID=A0A409YEW4_9AGAR|nr:hypothetical protein CVT24_001851 [Panaeolus cyanescens]